MNAESILSALDPNARGDGGNKLIVKDIRASTSKTPDTAGFSQVGDTALHSTDPESIVANDIRKDKKQERHQAEDGHA